MNNPDPATERRNLASTFAYNIVGESDFDFEDVANVLHQFVADTIASLIDAGSEREAILEDENLRNVLIRVAEEWLNPDDGIPVR